MENAAPHIAFYSFDSVAKEFNDFLNAYYPKKIIVCPEAAMNDLKPPTERICRFCKKSHNQVSFGNVAHVIPEFLGNRNLISDFECDTCNSKFSKYETDFSAWIGVLRTILKTSGKKGTPTFKPFKEGMSAREMDFLDKRITKISDQNPSNGAIKMNKESGEITLQFKKESYTPINVYKSLIKIALSLIDESDVEDYKNAFDFISTDNENSNFRIFAKVMCHELLFNHRVKRPCGIVFKRIKDDKQLPLHFFLLYYENFIYCFPLPFNGKDLQKGFYSDSIDVIFPPPIVFTEPDNQSAFYNHIQDFSQTEKVRNEIQTMKLNVPPDTINNPIALDPKTGELKSNIEPSEIVALYLVPEGTQIPVGKKFEMP